MQPREGWILAVDGMERDVAGMPQLLRTACALKAAGIERIVVIGEGRVDGIAGDPRLAGTTLVPAAAPPDGVDLRDSGDAILVARGDRVFHRDGPRTLAHASGETRAIAGWDALVVT